MADRIPVEVPDIKSRAESQGGLELAKGQERGVAGRCPKMIGLVGARRRGMGDDRESTRRPRPAPATATQPFLSYLR